MSRGQARSAVHMGGTAAQRQRVGRNKTDGDGGEIRLEPSLVHEGCAKGVMIEKRIKARGDSACQKHAAFRTEHQRNVTGKSGKQEEEGCYRLRCFAVAGQGALMNLRGIELIPRAAVQLAEHHVQKLEA